ncbi:MAG: hypothetical protein AAFW46_14320 [Pseudomonadota bacterium]
MPLDTTRHLTLTARIAARNVARNGCYAFMVNGLVQEFRGALTLRNEIWEGREVEALRRAPVFVDTIDHAVRLLATEDWSEDDEGERILDFQILDPDGRDVTMEIAERAVETASDPVSLLCDHPLIPDLVSYETHCEYNPEGCA